LGIDGPRNLSSSAVHDFLSVARTRLGKDTRQRADLRLVGDTLNALNRALASFFFSFSFSSFRLDQVAAGCL